MSFSLKESEIIQNFLTKLINEVYPEGDSYVLNRGLSITNKDVLKSNPAITVILPDGYNQVIKDYNDLSKLLNNKFNNKTTTKSNRYSIDKYFLIDEVIPYKNEIPSNFGKIKNTSMLSSYNYQVGDVYCFNGEIFEFLKANSNFTVNIPILPFIEFQNVEKAFYELVEKLAIPYTSEYKFKKYNCDVVNDIFIPLHYENTCFHYATKVINQIGMNYFVMTSYKPFARITNA